MVWALSDPPSLVGFYHMEFPTCPFRKRKGFLSHTEGSDSEVPGNGPDYGMEECEMLLPLAELR